MQNIIHKITFHFGVKYDMFIISGLFSDPAIYCLYTVPQIMHFRKSIVTKYGLRLKQTKKLKPVEIELLLMCVCLSQKATFKIM